MGNKRSSGSLMAIFSIYFLSQGISIVVPALSTIISHFAEQGYPISTLLLISNLPSLLGIPATLLSGMFAGSKIKYKTLVICGIFLFVAAGVAPAFTDNFIVILVERGLCGIGLGLISPLGHALILGLYDGQKRAKTLGYGIFFMNIGGILMQLFGGYLCSIGWNYTFYTHLIGIVSLFAVILFLPEPEAAPKSSDEKRPKVKIPAIVYILSLLYGVVFMLNYTALINMSSIIELKGIGNSTVAGLVLSLQTVGGMLGGLIFAKLFSVMKRYIISLGLLFMTLSLAGIYFLNNVILIGIAVTLMGLGFSTIMATNYMIFGMKVDKTSVAAASSVLQTSSKLFIFLSTFWVSAIASLTNDAVMTPIFIGMVIIAVLCAALIFLNPVPKQAADKPEQ